MKKEELLTIANMARKHALAESTNYTVGAALLAKSGTVYLGSNVEDCVIPALSNCAERVAIQSAISHGEREFEAIAIVGGNEGTEESTLIPCGVCLQYILDMCANIEIITHIEGKVVSNKVTSFLNVPFILKQQDDKEYNND